jgi:putative peptide modification system cyclase
MESILNADLSADVEPQSGASSVLRTLVLCDLVDSTGLVERLGDLASAELIRKHDRLARTLADRHGGREIDKTDGFMMMFERPVQAVAFALDYQRGLRQLRAAESITLTARVGIHVGDVVVWDNSAEDIARGAKPVEVEGLVKPITSRLMSLALPGQILLSNIAYDLAHRAQGELGELLANLRWRTHGRYRFRGVPDPVAVFEVGEEGLAPLKAPPWSSKAHREVPFWRRPATMVIEVLVIAALIAVPLIIFLRPDPAIAFAKRDWVVVGSLHNLTGETVFDDALESALRIGLEQSRYVNVLPDLKVRDTISRMQRDPDKTEIDRAIGSEVAIRDGARALILPTIAEIGGRVRITAEVIDPQTQTTVYSETADGIGKESILPSLDTINSRLRVRLGEALATVSSESLPLENVATKNLDALRAYSLAHRALDAGDIKQAEALYLQSVEMDSKFARAKIGLGAIYRVHDREEEAHIQFVQALANKERLSASDRMLAEAWLSTFSSPRTTLEKWKALATLQPDMFQAEGAYAFYSWIYANDYSTAIAAVSRNVVIQNPNRGTGLYLLGTLYLGTERYTDAVQKFAESVEAGRRVENDYYAAAYAVQRKFDKLPELRKAARSAETSGARLLSRIMRLTMTLDQGQWLDIPAATGAAENELELLEPSQNRILRNAILALHAVVGSRAELDAKLRNAIASINREDPQSATTSSRADAIFVAWLAARFGGSSQAKAILERLGDSARDPGYPARAKMYALIEAESALQIGDAAAAIGKLNEGMDGTELYFAHVTLMDAFALEKDYRAAREQARWLASHRGRAYTEVTAGEMFIPINVAQSNLAILSIAEYSALLGDLNESNKALQQFRALWPTIGMPDWIVGRIEQVERLEAKRE